jgi:hypothetical protein
MAGSKKKSTTRKSRAKAKNTAADKRAKASVKKHGSRAKASKAATKTIKQHTGDMKRSGFWHDSDKTRAGKAGYHSLSKAKTKGRKAVVKKKRSAASATRSALRNLRKR